MSVANKKLVDQIAQTVAPAHMKHYGQEQRSIIRQSSIKSATELMSSIIPFAEQLTTDEIVNETIRIAGLFEEWVTR